MYYIIGHLLYALLLPYGARLLDRVGYNMTMVVGTVWNTFFYTALFLVASYAYVTETIILLLFASVIFLVLFRLSFWMPYHVEVAKLTKRENRGTSISLILALVTIAGVVGPLIGGYVIDSHGFMMVFIVIAVTSLFAFIPLFFLSPANEKFEWNYAETWRQLISKKHRGLVLAMFANGAENVVGIVVWPIFIFLLLDESYIAVGTISSLIVAITIAVQIFTGKYLDYIQTRGQVLRIGSILSAFGWIVKMFVVTAFHIFVAGLYHNFARIFTNTPIDTMYYDLAADSGHYIDEITVLRETALQLGKVVTLAFAIILSFFVAIQWVFLIAACSALLLNSIYVSNEKERV